MNIYQTNSVKPKFIPLKCPVCRGFKTVNWGKMVCSVCAGKGYIEVPPAVEEIRGEKDGQYTNK